MSTPEQIIAARSADLRVLLDHGTTIYEGITLSEALKELLDAIDQLFEGT